MKFSFQPKSFLFIGLFLSFLNMYAGKSDGNTSGYPSFDEVVEHESKYLPFLNDMGPVEKYSLAKKPDGWYWQAEKYAGNDWQVFDSKLCWSAHSHKFLVNKVSNSLDLAAKVKNQFLQYGVLRYDFAHENYFGYRGWTDDVIKLLADSSTLCDYNYEALARAYSSEAFYRVNQWGDFATIERRLKLAEKPNCMTRAQQDTFCKYEHLAAQTYLRLQKQNPDYETMVGNTYCKYSNEVMATYLLLAYYQNMAEAKKELVDGLYDSFMIAFAKNLLNSCGPNAILITQGDNDTYPLYYMQAQYGYRKDVLIVNASLLGTARYINFVRSGVFDAQGLPLTIDTARYAGDSLSYITKKDSLYNKLVKGTDLDFEPNKDYLYKSDIMVLNAIAVNNWQRPIYLSMAASSDVALNMDKYFRAEGLVYKLVKEKSSVNSLYDAPVNTSFVYPFLMDTAVRTDWDKEPFIGDNIVRITDNYQGIYSRLAAALYAEEKYDECVAVLDRYIRDFPENKIPYTVYMINMPDLYAKCKHFAQAKALTQKLTDIGNKGYEAHINNSKYETLDDWKRNMESALYILQQLVPLVKKYYIGDNYAAQYEADFNAKHAKYYKMYTQLSGAK